MAKYLILWEVDLTRTPENPTERKTQWSGMIGMVKADLKAGKPVKDFGEFLGQDNGYFIAEGTQQEIHDYTHKWVPFIKFQVRAVADADMVEKAIQTVA